MQVKVSLLIFLCIFSFRIFSQEEISPLERTLSGIVTVGVFEVKENDQPFGFAKKKKTYAEIAYEQTLDMGDVFSNGSGFILEIDGKYYIITNAHVVDAASEGAGAIFAFSITRNKYPVRIVGGDSFYDIAILEFADDPPGPEIVPLTFSEQEATLAQKVYAIGNPLGNYPYTITEGIISGKNRLYHRPTTGRFGFLQHTATLIWGNSGGPLVDENGQVVGINTWIETRTKGNQNYLFSQLNFALEGRLAQKLVREILDNGGRLRRAYLGVEFAIRSNDSEPDGLPFIKSVMEGSPAYETLKDRIGYTVASINEQPVQTLQDIVRSLESAAPGNPITFDLKKEMTSPKAEVPAGELSTENLEQIAHYFFDSYTDYEISENSSGIALKGKEGKASLRIEQFEQAGEGDNWASFTAVPGKDSYGLAGLGGITKQGQLSLYQAATAKDLGAVIRLCTLEGHLGAKLVSGTEYAGTVRFYLEDADFNEIKVLYY